MIIVSFVLFAMLIFAWLAAPDAREERTPEPVPVPANVAVHAG